MRFRTRLSLVTIVPLTILALLLTGFSVSARLSRLDVELVDRAQIVANQLAVASEFGLFSGNRVMLEGVGKAILRERDVVAVVIRGGDGQVGLSLGNPQALAEHAGATRSGRFIVAERSVERPILPLDDLFSSQASDAPQLPTSLGVVGVVLTRDGLRQVRQQIIGVSLFVTIVLIGLAWILSLAYSRRLAEQMSHLAQAVRRMGGGARDVRVSIVNADSEMVALADGFNAMASQIEESQRGLQQKIERATRELNDRRMDAERANQSKSRFLAAASHDLRQPLHALGLFADQLARRNLLDEDGRLVGRIVETTGALSELLDALLDISRLDAGVLSPQVTAVDLSSMLRRMDSEFSAIAESKGLRFVTHGAKVWAASDPAMLERILMNLISNALRYTEQGTILLAVRRRNGMIRLEVRDSGIGIPTESQQLVFSEFVQLHNPERDRRKGLGLGLSIVQRMCNLLGHSYGLKSQTGRGSVFWVEVPLTQAPEVKSVMPVAVNSDLAGRVVALVEDDPLALEGMAGQLRAWGCEVFSAASGAEITARLAQQAARPELVVCDQNLPNGEQGLQVIQILRQRYGPELAAVLVTGQVSRDLQDAAEPLGIPVMAKPVRPAKLRAVLQGLFARGSGGN